MEIDNKYYVDSNGLDPMLDLKTNQRIDRICKAKKPENDLDPFYDLDQKSHEIQKKIIILKKELEKQERILAAIANRYELTRIKQDTFEERRKDVIDRIQQKHKQKCEEIESLRTIIYQEDYDKIFKERHPEDSN